MSSLHLRTETAATRPVRLVDRVPPHAWFVTSAAFHYLGPAFAVLLFVRVDVLGVAWLRIASAAVVFAVWRRPWRTWRRLDGAARRVLLALGGVLGAMNCVFYLAIERVPLGTVGAIEFLGPVLLALAGARSARNLLAVGLAVAGVAVLSDVHWVDEPVGLLLAFANCALFGAYVVLGHRLAADGGPSGIDRLGLAMLVATVVVAPVGLVPAAPTVGAPVLLLAAVGVGICSSVVPYVTDQLAMARLPRSTFALLLALLPATATLIGLLVLGQVPSPPEVAGVALVVSAVLIHHERSAA